MSWTLRAFVLALTCGATLTVNTPTAFAQSVDLPHETLSGPLRFKSLKLSLSPPFHVDPSRWGTPAAVVRTSHRFFDACTIASTAAETAALLADGIYTQRGLTRYPDRVAEADPVAREFVSHGWPGQIVGGAIFIGADLGIRYILHRKDHHRVERWIPTFLISYGITGAIHDARLIGEAERCCQ